MHVCKYGDTFCGRWGFDSLCEYCKKAAKLELAVRENDINGQRVRANRESRDMAYDALGQAVAENPGVTLGLLAGAFGLSLAVKSYQDSKKKTKEMPSFAKRKK